MDQAPIVEIDLGAIDTSLSRLRLVNPLAEARMLESMRRQGQLTPVVVGRVADNSVVLVDGFKRYRAWRQIGVNKLKAQVLEMPVRALKAAIVQLNGRDGLKSIEEALVLQSMHREDGLRQEEIGVLLGRHKSWVCRRLALVERLCDEAQDNLRLGLISPRVCRALLQLPRGNQPRVLQCVLKHCLNSRETAQLVRLLRERPAAQHGPLLWLPLPILDQRMPPVSMLPGAAAAVARRLRTLARKARGAADLARTAPAASWSDDIRRKLTLGIEPVAAALATLRDLLCSVSPRANEDF